MSRLVVGVPVFESGSPGGYLFPVHVMNSWPRPASLSYFLRFVTVDLEFGRLRAAGGVPYFFQDTLRVHPCKLIRNIPVS